MRTGAESNLDSGRARSPTEESGLIVDDRVEWYRITGSTEEQLGLAIHLLGPRRGGAHFAAYTEWVVEWSPSVVRARVVMHLPEWLAAHYPPNLKASWDAFVAGLIAHERGHRDIAIQTARAVREVQSRSDLTSSSAAVREIEAILDEARERERRYDEETRHGEADERIGGRDR